MSRMIAARKDDGPDDDLDPYVVLLAATDLVAMLIGAMPDELRERVEEWLEQWEE